MEQWKHLRVQNEQLPPLLIKASFGKHGYIIKLTDLSRVWLGTLSKDEIITQARKHTCSIDPAEDAGQYRIFLEKLQSALNQDGQTNLAISLANNGKLKLLLDAPLPSPLPTLEWEVNLQRAHDSVTGAELVSPLLRRAYNLNHCMGLLIAEIQAKDKVIAKITDRLETSGHDLTAVFPGVSNVKLTKNTSQQEQFARHVRGLGRFNEQNWKAQLDTATNTAVLPEIAEDAIFASLPRSDAVSENADKAADWWQRMPVGQHIDLVEEGSGGGLGEAGKVSNQQPSHTKQDTSDADLSEPDDFQRQATPFRLRSHSPPTTRQDDVDMGGTNEPALSDEESTEDEDDLDKPLQSQVKPHKRASCAAVVEAPLTSPQRAATSTLPPSTTRGPFTHEEETEDEDDDDLDRPSQPSQKTTSTSQLASRQKSQSPQPAAPTITKSSPRKTLGKLGGRLPSKSTSKTSTPSFEEELSHPAPITNPPLSVEQSRSKPRLGTIGGTKAKVNDKARSPSPPPAAPTTSTTRSPATTTRHSKEDPTPEPRSRPRSSRLLETQQHVDKSVETKTAVQTEAERADAKREALKRELEAKAKAPVKKKRKF